jgi:hypothetical protein
VEAAETWRKDPKLQSGARLIAMNQNGKMVSSERARQIVIAYLGRIVQHPTAPPESHLDEQRLDEKVENEQRKIAPATTNALTCCVIVDRSSWIQDGKDLRATRVVARNQSNVHVAKPASCAIC